MNTKNDDVELMLASAEHARELAKRSHEAGISDAHLCADAYGSLMGQADEYETAVKLLACIFKRSANLIAIEGGDTYQPTPDKLYPTFNQWSRSPKEVDWRLSRNWITLGCLLSGDFEKEAEWVGTVVFGALTSGMIGMEPGDLADVLRTGYSFSEQQLRYEQSGAIRSTTTAGVAE